MGCGGGVWSVVAHLLVYIVTPFSPLRDWSVGTGVWLIGPLVVGGRSLASGVCVLLCQ